MFRQYALVTWYLIYGWQKPNRSHKGHTPLSLSPATSQKKMRAVSKGKNLQPSGMSPFPLGDFLSPPKSSSTSMNDLAVSYPWWSSPLNGTVGGNHSVRWFLGPPNNVFDGLRWLSTIGQMMRCDVLSFQSPTNQGGSLSINLTDFIQLEVSNAWLRTFAAPFQKCF